MTTTAHIIPVSTEMMYRLDLHEIQRLDDSGEPCRYCQEQDVYVEVQAYAKHADTGQPVMVSCCCTCLAKALFLADADMLEQVTIEYERANPVGLR